MRRRDAAGGLPPSHLRAASALARGLPLPALAAVGRFDDPDALALRGIALAQLQEPAEARALLDRAAAKFARAGRPLERARALAASAEAAAAQRDFAAAERLLTLSGRGLLRRGDRRNAAWVFAVHSRLATLRGDGARARALLARAEAARPAGADANIRTQLAIARAELATRARDGAAAAASLDAAPHGAALPLAAEARGMAEKLRRPVAIARGRGPDVPLDAVALTRLVASEGTFVVDTMARRAGGVDLRRRPVLLQLLAALALRWPQRATWRELARCVFGFPRADASLLARCKTEIDRLRALLPSGASVAAARGAWRLELAGGAEPVVLVLPGPADLMAAMLEDGAAWSVGDLAAATSQSRSTALRALRALVRTGRAVPTGRARARRYVSTAPRGIASQMLLVGLLAPAGE